MAINGKHASIILKRVFDRHDPSEQIELISGKDKLRNPIHRVILSAASEYFTDLLGPDFQGEKPKEFLLDGYDGATIKAIVNFCYTGDIDLTDENVENILEIASKLEIDLLEDKCREFCAAKLGVANAVNILIISDKYALVELREKALNLICDQFDALPTGDCEKWSQEFIHELFKHDKIHAFGDMAAKRLLDWFQWDEEGRGMFMPELLKLIRMEQLTFEFLRDAFEPICKKFKCAELVSAEYKRRCMEYAQTGSTSIYCVCLQGRNYFDAKIKISKYNDTTNCFEEVRKIQTVQHYGFSVVMQKNKIFVLGGDSGGRKIKFVFSYDLSTGKQEQLPEMKVARAKFTSILVGKHIYVLGGCGGSEPCERFDIENNKWESLAPMHSPRYNASATVLNGYIYIAGGSYDEEYYDEADCVEFYNPKTDKWTKTAAMNEGRVKFALLESNGSLYAMGCNEVIERFAPHTNRWTKIGSFAGSDMIDYAINVDGKLFAISGNGEFGRVFASNKSEQCSFVPLCRSIYDQDKLGSYFLFHV